MSEARGELWVIRRGETAWTLSGAHTGRTDIPLTAMGERQAAELGQGLAERRFALVLGSPLCRALDTCRIAGYGDVVEITDDLLEWDYGAYEGRTTADIQQEVPGWSIWTGNVPNGETAEKVGMRAQRVIKRAFGAGGDVVLFSHGHVLRVLAACWLGLQPNAGRLFALGTATVSVLGYERATLVIRKWNLGCEIE